MSRELVKNVPRPASELWQLRQWPLQRLNGRHVSRFASTTPFPPPIVEVQPDFVPPPHTSTPAEADFSQIPFDELTTSIPTPVYDHIGFLKEMGLDYGWGPTAFIQNLLEHVHIYLGTPWWASIGISMLLIRVALLKFYIEAADCNARRQAIRHLEQPIDARVKAARLERNIRAQQEATLERLDLYKSAGIKVWKTFVPFLQLPLGFGMFRLMRGMATLPVPGFDTGGLLWMSDLTIPDPYFVLPLFTTWAYYYTFKVPRLTVEHRQMR